MARLNSWLSADITHALGWALIHALWQCLGLVALAAIAMAFSRRPSIRYLVAIATLVATLAAPAATFLVLMKSAAPLHAPLAAHPRARLVALSAAPPRAMQLAPAAAPKAARRAAPIPAQASGHFFMPRLPSADILPPKLFPLLVGAWLCGVALFSLRFAGGFLLLEYRRRSLCDIAAPRILALCHTLQRQLGLNRAIRYLDCSWIQTPAVIGWIRPVILLPVCALAGLSEAQLRAVIAHELAHIRRHDFLMNLLQTLVETLLFYHPAIWWLNRRIRAERELCCDEIAVSLTGDRLEYARVLTLMAQWDGAPALAMAANRGPLSRRIFHILGKKPFGAGQRILGLTGSVLFLAGALGAANALFGIAYPIPMAHAKADPKPVLPPRRIAVDRDTPPVRPPAAPVKDASPEQDNDAARQDKAALERPEAAAKLVVPMVDLSALPAQISLPKPVLVASNERAAARSRSCALPSVADTVGLKTVAGSDLMTVPVQINGATRQFLLDLSTDPIEVSAPLVDELRLPHVDKTIASKGGPSSSLPQAFFFDVKGSGTARDYQARVRIASFAMGDAMVNDMQFLVADDRDMGKSEPYDGRLTRSNFPQYDIDLDFGGKALSFLAPTSCTDPDQVAYWPHAAVAVVPMTLSGGRMQVQVTIRGHVIDAVIDTGAARTVMRRDIAERIFGLKAGTPEMMPAGDLRDGTDMQIYSHTFAQISFTGGVTANNVPALIEANSMVRKINRTPVLGSRATFAADPGDRIPDLALGMDVLHQLHLYAAFEQNRLYVTAADHGTILLSAE